MTSLLSPKSFFLNRGLLNIACSLGSPQLKNQKWGTVIRFLMGLDWFFFPLVSFLVFSFLGAEYYNHIFC